MIYLDTHVVAWLYAGLSARLPLAARDLLNDNDLYISPMVILELHYLYDIGRITAPGDDVVRDLSPRIGLRVCGEPFPHIIAQAAEQVWTRDPFDRIIVGHAALRQRLLVTKDRTMHEHYLHAFWSAA